jgi:DNA-binding HxlR family transcriptional regulator
MPPSAVVYRRVASLVCDWHGGGFAVRDYAANRRRRVTLDAFSVLFHLDSWTDARTLLERLPAITPAALRSELRRLRSLGLVEASTDPPRPPSLRTDRWMTWEPDAAMLHFGTKNLRRIPLAAANRARADRLAVEPCPHPEKSYGTPRRTLPPYPRTGALPRVLLQRRTWRRFGGGALALRDVSTLLGLTWGVQG